MKRLFVFACMGGVLMTGLVGGVSAEPAGVERRNIEFLKTLEGRGTYLSLQGHSLFLTRDVGTNSAGYWFDLGQSTSAAPVSASLPAAWDVAVTGECAWVCDYTVFLAAYDIRQPQWQQVARLKMPSMTENIIIRGNLAYIANHTAGLTIVDISTPSKPSIVGAVNPGIDCDALALRQNCAILYGHHESRLVLVDVTDPAKPVQTGVYQHDPKTFTQGEMDVLGDYAYCTAVNGLVIVNIADSANPKLVKTVPLPMTLDIVARDGYAFVACRDGSVRVLDVTDPAKAEEIAFYKDAKALSATNLAVDRVTPSRDAARKNGGPDTAATAVSDPGGDYDIYVANAKGAAMALRFCSPGHAVREDR